MTCDPAALEPDLASRGLEGAAAADLHRAHGVRVRRGQADRRAGRPVPPAGAAAPPVELQRGGRHNLVAVVGRVSFEPGLPADRPLSSMRVSANAPPLLTVPPVRPRPSSAPRRCSGGRGTCPARRGMTSRCVLPSRDGISSLSGARARHRSAAPAGPKGSAGRCRSAVVKVRVAGAGAAHSRPGRRPAARPIRARARR
jgi:hypothetical protein